MAPSFTIAAGSNTAISKVFTNVDLMEDILLRLPIREILHLNGVCQGLQKVYNDSPRIQKVLFLSPATEHKIYYPNHKKSFWYLSPDRKELLTAGFVPQDSDDNDDAMRRRTAQAKPASNKREVKFAEGVSLFDGKLATISDGKFRNPIHFTPVGRYPSADGSGSGSGSGMATEDNGTSNENTCKAMVLYNGSDNGTTGTQVKGKIDSATDIKIPEQKGKGKVSFATNTSHARGKYMRQRTRIPRSPDGKMMVSRVSGPFINPFIELFFERFFRGIRCVFYPESAVPPYIRPDITYEGPLAVHPKIRHADGTTQGWHPTDGRSLETQAVMRYEASWRKMRPFSATTSSVEFECFDFGLIDVHCDWGLLCGNMMEQLGEHWSTTCRECCIPHYWFAEFTKKVSYTDGSHVNRGNHGVRKLGSVNQTGWEILALLNAAPIEVSCFKDRIRPY